MTNCLREATKIISCSLLSAWEGTEATKATAPWRRVAFDRLSCSVAVKIPAHLDSPENEMQLGGEVYDVRAD